MMFETKVIGLYLALVQVKWKHSRYRSQPLLDEDWVSSLQIAHLHHHRREADGLAEVTVCPGRPW